MFFIVMLFADAVVFTVVTMVPTPVIDVMGGIRHTDRDALIASVTFTLVVLSVLTAPIWILGSLVAVGWLRPDWRVERSDSSSPRSLLILAIASVLAFLPAMVVTQPEQVNRRKAESMMLRGDVASAFDFMSARFASDFPPQWNPPPKLGYQEREPELTEVRRVMEAEWPAEWVASIYLEKMGRFLKQDLLYIGGSLSWAQVADRYEQRGDEQLSEDQRAIVQMLRDRDESLTRTDRDALDRLIRLEAGGAEASGDAPSDGT
ncbi:MAG: hypothetical protein ACFHWZ_18445 [Phycisphaerales bacterium]